ncbi:MAG: hypothetical protein M3Z96_07545 [Pseudomonadota bacterium]|nr:hypothetical protein [Pseudomonadota bacterium]
MELIGGALDDRSESDFAPVVLEKIAQQGFERRLFHWQGEDVDGCAVDIDHAPWPIGVGY